MMMGYDWGFGWGGMWFGWLMMIGFTVAVVVLIVWLVRLSTPGAVTNIGATSADSRSQSALDILQAGTPTGKFPKRSI